MTKGGQIEESELELKFIHSLRKYVDKQDDERWSFSESKENGIIIYHLSIPTLDGSVAYLIRPQVSLGETHGVKESTRTDFYFTCVKVVKGDIIIDEGYELEAYKDLAIYMDGYTFHASKQHMRFYQDLKIRDAIAETTNIGSWTLSWNDLVKFDEEEKDELFLDERKYRETINKLSRTPLWKRTKQDLLKKINSMDRMLWYLSNSNEDNINTEIGLFAACFQGQFANPSFSEEQAVALLDPKEIVDLSSKELSPDGNFYMLSELTRANELFKSRLFVRLKDFSLLSSINVTDLESIDKDVWEEFWRVYSVL